MIQLGNFYYHRDECFTCSQCKHNEIAQVSEDGKTYWCKSCWNILVLIVFIVEDYSKRGYISFSLPDYQERLYVSCVTTSYVI